MSYFVTGTDTGVGKTLISCALLRGFAAQGLRVVGMKPVAAGGSRHSSGDTPDVPPADTAAGSQRSSGNTPDVPLAGTAAGSRHSSGNTPDVPLAGTARWSDPDMNEDVRALLGASNVMATRGQVNPYCFERAVAPNLAAHFVGVSINLDRIVQSCHELVAQADMVIVEGVGGFRVPLNDDEDGGDLAQQLALPVILVVGIRLGCMNHALLTQEAISNCGLTLAGWVANCVDARMEMRDENIAALKARIDAPLLGIVPYCVKSDATEVAACLDLRLLDWAPGSEQG